MSPVGLPDYRGRTSDHSNSNHQRAARESPGCQRICARPDRLRLSLAGSPSHADQIQFTAAGLRAGLCFGLRVLVPLLSTPPPSDAATVPYPTVLPRAGADFPHSVPSPSQAHERDRSPVAARASEKGRESFQLLPACGSAAGGDRPCSDQITCCSFLISFSRPFTTSFVRRKNSLSAIELIPLCSAEVLPGYPRQLCRCRRRRGVVDQRRTETMGKLLKMFFRALRMRGPSGVGERDVSAFARTLLAFERNDTEAISRLQEHRAG